MCSFTLTMSFLSSCWHVWIRYMVIMVNSKGACVGVLSKISKLHPHIPVQVWQSLHPSVRRAKPTARGSASWGGSSVGSGSHGLKTPPSHPFAVSNVLCARVFGAADLPRGVGVVGWQRSREREPRSLQQHEYTIADHRHTPSKHNSSTDKRLQRWLPVYLPTLTKQSTQL